MKRNHYRIARFVFSTKGPAGGDSSKVTWTEDRRKTLAGKRILFSSHVLSRTGERKGALWEHLLSTNTVTISTAHALMQRKANYCGYQIMTF